MHHKFDLRVDTMRGSQIESIVAAGCRAGYRYGRIAYLSDPQCLLQHCAICIKTVFAKLANPQLAEYRV